MRAASAAAPYGRRAAISVTRMGVWVRVALPVLLITSSRFSVRSPFSRWAHFHFQRYNYFYDGENDSDADRFGDGGGTLR